MPLESGQPEANPETDQNDNESLAKYRKIEHEMNRVANAVKLLTIDATKLGIDR